MVEDGDSVDSLIAAVARIPARQETWTPPAELDEYRLIKPLGRGGMGSVWLAEDRLLARQVALKFIAHAEPDKATRERFAVEARAAARLAHVNVVTVHRFGEVAGRPYLVSEYIRGESLDRIAKPVPSERALELGIALARGLAAAHRHGIVHRDIKPANAILTGDGEVKLVDFGLAKLGGEDDLARPGVIAGTPLYLAPEVRAGEPATRRADVYQLGCVLYELVIGRAPLHDARGGEVPLLAPRLGRDGTRFAAIVDRCLRSDPAARYASGDELREALEELVAPTLGGELPEGNPYRGLVAFEAEHRALFFGRGADIRALIERMRESAFVLVTGDSGVGKSSLCRAGVLPHVSDGALADGLAWSTLQLMPGQQPMATLASLLAPRLGVDEDAVMAMLPGQIPRELRRALGARNGLVLFVDQLEELVTLADRDQAARFAEVLAELAVGAPGLRVLATVRSDFLMRVAELPRLGAEVSRALYLLRPLSEEGAREAVVGPARAKGVHFESDELVNTLVASVTELPLLAFTLAQLWDERDETTHAISARSLEAIGGVRGALARHADAVLDGMLPRQRELARTMLLRLVTPDRTRARRTAEELGDRAVLDALVRGRLLVARGEEPPAFELVHEQLIDGWPTFAAWISQAAEAIAVHARLTAAVATWEHLGRSKEALWRKRPLADLAILSADALSPAETEFVTRSRRAQKRRRILLRTLAVAIPVVAATFYGGARFVARRDLARTIAINVDDAARELALAHASDRESSELERAAFARFDAGDVKPGETMWATALAKTEDARTAYSRASRVLEAAFLLDTARDDVRHRLAEVTYERILLAEREHREDERNELAARLPLYDDGTIAARLIAPATVKVAITPPATVTLADSEIETQLPAMLPPGAHVIVARAPGRAIVRIPVLLARGEHRRVDVALPPSADVPAGFVFVPPGPFLYGSRDAEPIRSWFPSAPMHEVTTGAYLIATTETTYAQWIEFLDDVPAEQQATHRPHIESSATIQTVGPLELTRTGKVWTLAITPTNVRYTAAAGSPIEYADRATRRQQDWLKMPVSGVSPEDAEAFTAWLDRSGRVPHARLCSEVEWERAARGSDGRSYPHARTLAPDDANIDATYGHRDGGYGPDEVGSHPASTSPFGLADTSGNVWEVVRASSGTGFAMRGGAYFTGPRTAHLANRELIPPSYRHLHVGVRICADAR